MQNPPSRLYRARAVFTLLLLASAPCIPAFSQSAAESYRQAVLAIQQHIESGDLDGAHSLLDQAARHFPNDGGLENLLGVIEIQQGHPEQARQAFAAAVKHSPRLVSAYLNLARVDMETASDNSKDRAEALHAYESVLRIEPGNPEANYQAATLLMWSQHYQLSLDHLAKLGPQDRDQVGAVGIACVDEAGLGHKAQADHAAAALAARQDLNEQVAMILLPGLRATRRADLIETIFSAVDQREPLTAAGLRILGLAQEAEGKLVQARATLERCFARDPASTVALVDLARVAEESHDDRGALGYLAHARAINPKDASLPYRFGVICARMNLLGEARKAFEDAIKLAPKNPQYNLAMGTVAAFGHDPMEALPYFQTYHQLRPDDPVGTLALGSTYFRARDYDHAVPWLHQAAAQPRTAARALYYLGRIARDKNNLDEALRDLEQSAKLEPKEPDVLAEIGQIYVGLKRYPEAQKELEAALALDADNYAANFGLLQFYVRTQDARLHAQSARFEAVKNKREQESREMMRVIEIDPKGQPRH
ncbi:MAG TPA: tetratricopeptide repeat protein [Terracidiphilus sp.]|nr:tetratricopeptide repeat protein [Terracidiphilus sp.]